MKEEYFKWFSPNLGQDTEMLVFGHSGYPIILFPTSMGRFYQNRDFKLIDTVQWFIDNGLIKIYCPDSIDSQSWYAKHLHPGERVKNHIKYDKMIMEELVPRALAETGKSKVAFAGCSFGAYHATTFGFRYPSKTGYIFNMGGAYDVTEHLGGYYDDNVYYFNPPDFIKGLNDPAIYDMGIVFGSAEHDFCLTDTKKLSDILKNKGVSHWLDVRMGETHDWPVWRNQFPHYVSLMKF
ncbi:MAG: esterase [Bacteroidetes bacterium GWA2_30_7]|nr:MAG: esterase [Bacteroidetes bacterium GWA2_30_7]